MKEKSKNIIIGVLIIIILGFGYYNFFNKEKVIDKGIFQKKQECAQYNNLVKTKIKESGRVFKKETYTIKEIFYSPKLDTCLYAWVIHSTSGITEIYSIGDVFGGEIFTAGISKNSGSLFYKEIRKLKES